MNDNPTIESEFQSNSGIRRITFYPFGKFPLAGVVEADFEDYDDDGRKFLTQIVRTRIGGREMTVAQARALASALNAACDALELEREDVR